MEPIILFDGECGVCGAAVRFVLRWDRTGRFRFAPLGSTIGQRLRAEYGVAAVDSFILIDAGQAWSRSEAALQVLGVLGGWWRLVLPLRLLPVRWRDAGYDAVARRRQRLSAKLGLACAVPTPKERSRFLE